MSIDILLHGGEMAAPRHSEARHSWCEVKKTVVFLTKISHKPYSGMCQCCSWPQIFINDQPYIFKVSLGINIYKTNFCISELAKITAKSFHNPSSLFYAYITTDFTATMLIRIYLFVLAHCFSYFCCLTANDLREEGLTMVYGSEGLIPSSWGDTGQ